MEVHRSAAKHSISDADVVQAATHHVVAYRIDEVQDEGPHREVRLGLDTARRLLEVVVLVLDEDRQLAIHAMRARPQYLHPPLHPPLLAPAPAPEDA